MAENKMEQVVIVNSFDNLFGKNAGVTAGYSEELFRAIVATGIIWIYYEVC